MQRTAVRSTDLAIVGYEAETSTLEIAFKNGGVYQYAAVGAEIYQALMQAPSHGTYFNQSIKDKFQATKIH